MGGIDLSPRRSLSQFRKRSFDNVDTSTTSTEVRLFFAIFIFLKDNF